MGDGGWGVKVPAIYTYEAVAFMRRGKWVTKPKTKHPRIAGSASSVTVMTRMLEATPVRVRVSIEVIAEAK